MRKIDDVQHAVNQGEAKRDQRIDRAGHQAIKNRGNEDDRRWHGVYSAAALLGGCLAATGQTWSCHQAGGIGNTGLADANCAGRITCMSLPSTWVLTGAAP